jgi:lipopolysaccharide cholinephosphotransferase
MEVINEAREIQLKCLEIYKVFDRFCRDNELKYFFCGGALIGAVRHHGFIPWDDDIDVFMFRSDYEKLIPLWDSYPHKSHYAMLRTSLNRFDDTMLTQFSDENTTYIKKDLVNSDISHGLKLEIIPLDSAQKPGIRRKLQVLWAIVFCLFNRGFAPVHKGRAANLIGRMLLKVVKTPKARYRLWRFAEKQMCKTPITEKTEYLTELTVTYRYMKNRYPIQLFREVIYLNFENLKIPAPRGFHEYLTIAFGDYMSFPPVEEQVLKHEYAFMDLGRSYKEYRNIHYLAGKKTSDE